MQRGLGTLVYVVGLFANGFESGDTSAWTATVPPWAAAPPGRSVRDTLYARLVEPAHRAAGRGIRR